MKYTLDRYCSICSAIKCPLEITADDYFVASNGVVYNAIQAAYIVLRIMGYLRISCLLSILSFCLLASVYLSVYFFLYMCLYVRAYISKYTFLNIQIRSQMYEHLHVLHFIFYSTFTDTLNDREICLLSLHQAYGSGEINK